MRSQLLTFPNARGEQLAARLELPVNQHPHTFALFAHCFTCGKGLRAVRHISRALSIRGIAVLRFDFTGLGESEGDFADTNFSSNVEDLVAAARFLEQQYRAPAIIIGHSLGGAAAICAAAQLPRVRAVAAIGAPFDPGHVSHLFEEKIDDIEAGGKATVRIGERPFTVKRQFLEDIRASRISGHLQNLGRALLLMHSPQDRIVSIDNAAHLYKAARHPKSFVSLDGADHLLSDADDSYYAGDLIAAWARRYIDLPRRKALQVEKEVAVRLGAEGFTTDIMARHHGLTADEPERAGGNDFGPTPYELLSAGLGACTAMTLQMYARRKNWNLREVVVHLEHYKDYAADMADPETEHSKIDYFERSIELSGDLDETQRQRLLEIAEKCPVHRTLLGDIQIKTEREE